MSPTLGYFAFGLFRFPRVSGDEPTEPTPSRITLVFSPRERG